MRTKPQAAFLSYRLGGADGVGVESAKWARALEALGFSTRRVAGVIEGARRPDDTQLPFLAIDAPTDSVPDHGALAAALAGAELVVVENLCSLPLNLAAATLARDVLAHHHGRVCFHHHDLPWEREQLAHIAGFPPRRPGSLHVTISQHARRALWLRGVAAHCIHNSFDFDASGGERDATRAGLGFADEDVVLLQPTRAIPRKNVSGGLRFAAAVARELSERRVCYWITGPPEDGYDDEFHALLATAAVQVRVGRAPRAADAYAAADLVVFPSTWEGFGNPVVEAVAAHRMVAVGSYPVLEEIVAGIDVLSIDDPREAAARLRAPDRQRLVRNAEVARARFSIELLPGRIRDAMTAVGWNDW